MKKSLFLSLILAALFCGFLPSCSPMGSDIAEEVDGNIVITYDANGGKSQMQTMTVPSGVPLGYTPKATRAGFVFAGWNTLRDGSGEDVAIGSIFKTPVTVYAKWVASSSCISFKIDYSSKANEYGLTITNVASKVGNILPSMKKIVIDEVPTVDNPSWVISGLYLEDGTKLINADGTFVANIDGYTNDVSEWIGKKVPMFYIDWEKAGSIITINYTAKNNMEELAFLNAPSTQVVIMKGDSKIVVETPAQIKHSKIFDQDVYVLENNMPLFDENGKVYPSTYSSYTGTWDSNEDLTVYATWERYGTVLNIDFSDLVNMGAEFEGTPVTQVYIRYNNTTILYDPELNIKAADWFDLTGFKLTNGTDLSSTTTLVYSEITDPTTSKTVVDSYGKWVWEDFSYTIKPTYDLNIAFVTIDYTAASLANSPSTSATVLMGTQSMKLETAPQTSLADAVFDGYYDASNVKVARADGTFVPNVTGYTDSTGSWTLSGELTLHPVWKTKDPSKTITSFTGFSYSGYIGETFEVKFYYEPVDAVDEGIIKDTSLHPANLELIETKYGDGCVIGVFTASNISSVTVSITAKSNSSVNSTYTIPEEAFKININPTTPYPSLIINDNASDETKNNISNWNVKTFTNHNCVIYEKYLEPGSYSIIFADSEDNTGYLGSLKAVDGYLRVLTETGESRAYIDNGIYSIAISEAGKYYFVMRCYYSTNSLTENNTCGIFVSIPTAITFTSDITTSSSGNWIVGQSRTYSVNYQPASAKDVIKWSASNTNCAITNQNSGVGGIANATFLPRRVGYYKISAYSKRSNSVNKSTNANYVRAPGLSAVSTVLTAGAAGSTSFSDAGWNDFAISGINPTIAKVTLRKNSTYTFKLADCNVNSSYYTDAGLSVPTYSTYVQVVRPGESSATISLGASRSEDTIIVGDEPETYIVIAGNATSTPAGDTSCKLHVGFPNISVTTNLGSSYPDFINVGDEFVKGINYEPASTDDVIRFGTNSSILRILEQDSGVAGNASVKVTSKYPGNTILHLYSTFNDAIVGSAYIYVNRLADSYYTEWENLDTKNDSATEARDYKIIAGNPVYYRVPAVKGRTYCFELPDNYAKAEDQRANIYVCSDTSNYGSTPLLSVNGPAYPGNLIINRDIENNLATVKVGDGFTGENLIFYICPLGRKEISYNLTGKIKVYEAATTAINIKTFNLASSSVDEEYLSGTQSMLPGLLYKITASYQNPGSRGLRIACTSSDENRVRNVVDKTNSDGVCTAYVYGCLNQTFKMYLNTDDNNGTAAEQTVTLAVGAAPSERNTAYTYLSGNKDKKPTLGTMADWVKVSFDSPKPAAFQFTIDGSRKYKLFFIDSDRQAEVDSEFKTNVLTGLLDAWIYAYKPGTTTLVLDHDKTPEGQLYFNYNTGFENSYDWGYATIIIVPRTTFSVNGDVYLYLYEEDK